MTRHIKAFSWLKDIERFLRESIKERPLLNVCCGESLKPYADMIIRIIELGERSKS